MKKILALGVIASLFANCEQKKEVAPEVAKVEYAKFGDSISVDGAISKEELLEKFKNLKEGDTLEVKVASEIKEVCLKKGCWMSLDLGNNETVFTNFDYKFLMPLNSAKSKVIVNGKAFLEVTSVDNLKHYAKDAGKSQAAIDSITEPKVTYSFMADGVLIAK